MQRFANPGRFQRLARTVYPWTAALTVLCLAAGLWFALVASPGDYQMGESVRLMYVHVPSAWMALFSYVNLAIAGAVLLVWKHPLAELAGRAMAPVGACFTALCLITGSLWGQPMWGTWWVWDARLTSVLILFFLFLGYIALTNAFDDPTRGGKAAAVLALVGVVNVPIIKFSVDWWNTLHQPASLTRLDAPAIHSSMLVPLLLMAFGFTFYFVSITLVRMRAEILARRLRALQFAQGSVAAEVSA
ncbi:MAG: heme ABC transporter permease [Alphaproteobacteria bacterium]|nr:heme ABC transporter permease [Alphaproteobacteria bacterium]